ETVESADGVVAFEDADLLAEVRQPDAGGQTGHAGPDDGDVVVVGGVHEEGKTAIATKGAEGAKTEFSRNAPFALFVPFVAIKKARPRSGQIDGNRDSLLAQRFELRRQVFGAAVE